MDATVRTLPPLSEVKWFSTIKATIKDFMDDDAMGMGAEMAYHLLFALFPSLLLLFGLLGAAEQIARNVYQNANFSQELLAWLEQSLPATAYETLEPVIRTTIQGEATGLGWVLGFGFLLAIWSASAGTQALIKGCNVAYDSTETRNFLKQKLIAVGLTVALALLVIVAMVSLVFGERIGDFIATQLGLGGVFGVVWFVARIVLLLVFLVAALALVYYFGPNVEQSFNWITPGAVVTAVLWVLATIGFSIYINNFGGFGAYGVIGGVIVLIYWLYISSLVLLFGAEMNGILAQRHDPATIQDPRQKATGPQAQAGGVSRSTRPGSAGEQRESQAEQQGEAAKTMGRQQAGRHRSPAEVERRIAAGRQDPRRVAADRRAAEQKKGEKQRQGGNGQSPTAFSAAPDPNVDYHAWREYSRQHQPAKHLIWNMLHHGSKSLAVHGTRQVLGNAWRAVFDTRPPGEKPPKR